MAQQEFAPQQPQLAEAVKSLSRFLDVDNREAYDEAVRKRQAQDSPLKRGSREAFEGLIDVLVGALAGGREESQASIFGELLTAGVPFAGPSRQLVRTLGGKLVPKGIRAFHGGPRDFSAFDASKVGTGQGAQTWGHGLYFAENPSVARLYRNSTSRQDFTRKVSMVYDEFDDPADAVLALRDAGLEPSQIELVKQLEKDDWLGFDYPHQAVNVALSPDVTRRFPDLSPDTLKAIDNVGAMFEVNLRVNPEELLDLNLPVSQHSPQVRKALVEARGDIPTSLVPGPSVWEGGSRTSPHLIMPPRDPTGHDVISDLITNLEEWGASDIGSPSGGFRAAEEVSQRLREAGIPGSQYFDRGSRFAREGTRNFVMFSDEMIDILKKFALALTTGGGAALALEGDRESAR